MGLLNFGNWKILYWSGQFFAVQDCLVHRKMLAVIPNLNLLDASRTPLSHMLWQLQWHIAKCPLGAGSSQAENQPLS